MFSQRLDIKQTQSLVMTPQLQQAIKLLQLSNLELVEYLHQEVEKNPFLDLQQETVPASSPSSAHEIDGQPGKTLAHESEVDSVYKTGAVQTDLKHQADSAYDNAYNTDYGSDVAFSSSEGQQWDNVHRVDSHFDDDTREVGVQSNTMGLYAHLSTQISLSRLTPVEQMIAHVLTSGLDDAGYWRETVEEVSARLGVAAEMVERVLTVCQTFEPTGVFARTLEECLELQLKEQELLSPQMKGILANLEKVALKDYRGLMKVCDVDREELQHYLRCLRSLNPKPGSLYESSPVQVLIPDVLIRRDSTGYNWIVELNQQTLPKVMVNQKYYTTVSKGAGGVQDKETKAFVENNYQTASWLLRSLDQRASTILKVATEIVRQQDGFFEYGLSHLRPMNLKLIAESLELHESTISRVTANKYLRCPRGIFEMKFFFMSGVSSTDGDETISSQVVKQHIKQLIDKEEINNILSDDDLMKSLEEVGIKVARRTVSKYREALGIGSSVQRRRQKKE